MAQTEVFTQQIQTHYAPPDLPETILTALAAAGKDPERLTLEDLAPLDEFHIRGRQATVELAERLDLRPDQTVLDVGCGLGGASRYLAATFGCQVTGLDLTEAYVRSARMLAERTRLDGLVRYRQGSALEMPFEDLQFDVVWTQHAAMNIADKARMYQEVRRVLKPGGRIAQFDILAGPHQPVYFPVPWSRVPELSFLIRPEEMRGLLRDAGFQIQHWRDATEVSHAAFNQAWQALRQNGFPPLGYHVFLGSAFRGMAENVVRNLDEQRIVVIEAISQSVR